MVVNWVDGKMDGYLHMWISGWICRLVDIQQLEAKCSHLCRTEMNAWTVPTSIYSASMAWWVGPCFRRLLVGLRPQQPGFIPMSGH
jgi:hypothetical protein